MNKIKVAILEHNLSGMPIFLAKLTQRGHMITSIDDLIKLHQESISKTPSAALLDLPHTTIQRMCNLTVAIYGLSTKAVSQLRTHATRLTFMSTSTQYSDFSDVEDPYVIPEGMDLVQWNLYKATLYGVHEEYKELHKLSGDNDLASYLLPQALRKCLIISGKYPDWQYVLQTRLCNRNTREVQYICQLILKEINDKCGKVWADRCLPKCCTVGCQEGKFCCGHKYEDTRFKEVEDE